MAKQQSLAAQSGALTQELKLPSIFQAPADPIKGKSWPPYIAFCHPRRSDEWAKVSSKFGAPEEGDMILHLEGDVHRLDPAKLGWICAKQYWAEKNAAGTELIRASFDEMPHPFDEFVEAVVLVYLEDRVIVANADFRRTKCAGAKTMGDALQEASEISWADKSPAHKETLVAGYPWMRFYGLMTLSEQRIGKQSGLPYRTTKCEILPTSVPEWRLLKEFAEDPKTQEAMDKAADRFQSRIAELTNKLVKK